MLNDFHTDKHEKYNTLYRDDIEDNIDNDDDYE